MDNDKILDDLKNWQKDTQNVFDNLTTFVDGLKGNFTPEQQEMIDKQMGESFNMDGLKSEMDKINKKMQEEMSKFNS